MSEKFGEKSMNLDGVGNYIDTPDDMQIGDKGFSFECYIKYPPPRNLFKRILYWCKLKNFLRQLNSEDRWVIVETWKSPTEKDKGGRG